MRRAALALTVLALALPGCVHAASETHVRVLNQQSYPHVGGEWHVRFEARGHGVLSVSGIDTTVGARGDVSFEYLRAGDLDVIPLQGTETLEFPARQWDGQAVLSVRVNTPGPHGLLLEMGGSEARAYNDAHTGITYTLGGESGGPTVRVGDQFGTSSAGIGDVDGDGVPDLVVGSPSRSNSTGAVQVVLLNSDGTAKTSSEVSVSGVAAGNQFGRAVAGVGDVDRDGVPDIAVGSPNKNSRQGELQVVLLSSDGTAKSLGASMQSPTTVQNGALFGFSAAGIGDVDGDGVPDLAVGAPNVGSTGAVYVVLLNAAGGAKQTVTVANAANAQGDSFGASVAGVGDVDGDGIPDIAVGASNRANSAGTVWVVQLNADGTAKRADSVVDAPAGPRPAAQDRLGTSVAGIGDIDGDGIPDLVAGASSAGGGGSLRGVAHVVLLEADGGVKRSFEIGDGFPQAPSISDYDGFGTSVAGLGDLNRDGTAEIAVGAPGDDSRVLSGGVVHVISVDYAARAGDGHLRRTGFLHGDAEGGPAPMPGDRLGYSAAALGDVNGDGTPDFAVGARGDDTGGSNRGAAYVVMMAPDGSIDEIAKIASGTGGGPALSNDDEFGSGVAGIGDADSDGIPDLAVGARGSGSAGALYLVMLNADGTAKSTQMIDGSTANGPSLSAGDLFGESASSADLDGDGTRDVVVGAPGHSNTGGVHVLFMNSDETVKSSALIDGSTANVGSVRQFDWFGKSVAFIGDLDSDGVQDLMVGNTANDSGAGRNNNRGAAHVLFMNADGSVKSSATIDSQTANGPALDAQDEFGSSVASAGDVDGDRIPDVVAGASNDDGDGADAGALHLMLMKADGLPKETVEIGAAEAGGDAGGLFGSAASSADVDGDGNADLLSGASGADGRGEAHVLFMSGTSVRGTAALGDSEQILPLQSGGKFGSAVAGIGDLNRDGVPDLAVGASDDDTGGNDRGNIYVLFMNGDGGVDGHAGLNAATLRTPPLQLDGKLGSAVAGIGDLDRDGVPDIAAGAPRADGGFGQVLIVQMNSDGSVKAESSIGELMAGILLGSRDMFGASVAGVGDIDGDGISDIAVGAPRADRSISSNTLGRDQGAAIIMFMDYGARGPSYEAIKVPRDHALDVEAGDMLGSAVAGVGDIDGNGVPDIVVGAPGDDGRGSDARGAIHVLLMNRAGVLSAHEIGDAVGGGPALSDNDRFGASISGAGDVDGDGIPDIAVGASGTGDGWMLFMNSDGSARQAVQLGVALGLSTETLGESIAMFGDLDGDGAPEWAAGSPSHDDETDDDKGAAYLFSQFRPAFVTGVGSDEADGTYVIDDKIDLTVSFSDPVVVAGTPLLRLETGAVDRDASYVSGSGTDELVFEYTVREGDVSDDLGYVSVSSLTASGGSVAWSGRAASLELPRPGTLDSLSFAKQIVIDGIRPVIAGPVILDLTLSTLTLEFDREIDVSEIEPGGIVAHAGDSRTSLAGAALPSTDSSRIVIRLTGEQTRDIIEAWLADRPVRMDISSTAFQDVGGNHFAGVSNMIPWTWLTLFADSPAFSDSARSYKSGYAPHDQISASDSASSRGEYLSAASDSPVFSDSSRSYESESVLSDAPDASDSASSYGHHVRAASDSPAAFDSAASYKSGSAASDSPGPSDSAAAHKSGAAASDSPRASDSARAYKSGASAPDAPALADSAQYARTVIRAPSDTASASDAVRAYKSGASASDVQVPADSARHHKSAVHEYDLPALADSARSHVSSATASSRPSVSDSASAASARVTVSADTAAVSDSARAYKSAQTAYDAPSTSDSASSSGMFVYGPSDTAAVSDSARAYKSDHSASDSPALVDSASYSGMLVQGSSDVAAVSDSARAYKSDHAASDSPAVSDSASSAGMLMQGLLDAASVSDAARSYKSGASGTDSPALSDSASYSGMLVQRSSDTAVVSDSAKAYKSRVSGTDSPALVDSASYSGMLVQGISDAAAVSDSARAYESGAVVSDSPRLSDSAAGLGARASGHADALLPSDSAGAYKSALARQSAPALSDRLQWGSMRAASGQDSLDVADSARAYKSATSAADSPLHSDSSRGGASIIILFDEPAISDGAATGLPLPPISAADLPSVSDGARIEVLAPPPISVGGGPIIRGGSGATGQVLAVMHWAYWDTCSDDPRVWVAVTPDDGRVVVTIAGGVASVEGSAELPPASIVYSASVPDRTTLIELAATLEGNPTHDSKVLSADSCEGSESFTPFAPNLIKRPSDSSDAVPPAPEPPAVQQTARAPEPDTDEDAGSIKRDATPSLGVESAERDEAPARAAIEPGIGAPGAELTDEPEATDSISKEPISESGEPTVAVAALAAIAAAGLGTALWRARAGRTT